MVLYDRERVCDCFECALMVLAVTLLEVNILLVVTSLAMKVK